MAVVLVGRLRVYRPVVWLVILVILVICGYFALSRRPFPAESAVERNAYTASLALIRQRRVTDSVVGQSQAVLAANRNLRARVAALGGDLRDALDSADAVRDSANYNITLYVERLEAVAAQARVYVDSTDVLLAHLAQLDTAITRERQAWLAEREAATAKIRADSLVILDLRKRATCRIVGPVPCPSRRAAFLAGAIVPLILLL